PAHHCPVRFPGCRPAPVRQSEMLYISEVNDSILARQSFARLLVEILKAILPAFIALATLYVITTRVRGQAVTDIYLSLGAISTVLALLLLNLRRFRTDSHFGIDRGSLLVSTLGRWIALIGILLGLGYVTQYSEDYSRIIVVSWAVITPVLLVIA